MVRKSDVIHPPKKSSELRPLPYQAASLLNPWLFRCKPRGFQVPAPDTRNARCIGQDGVICLRPERPVAQRTPARSVQQLMNADLLLLQAVDHDALGKGGGSGKRDHKQKQKRADPCLEDPAGSAKSGTVLMASNHDQGVNETPACR